MAVTGTLLAVGVEWQIGGVVRRQTAVAVPKAKICGRTSLWRLTVNLVGVFATIGRIQQ